MQKLSDVLEPIFMSLIAFAIKGPSRSMAPSQTSSSSACVSLGPILSKSRE